jgi:hypothetical protein
MLAAAAERVKRLLAAGRTPAQIAAAGVMQDYDEKWGNGFIKPPRFVEMVTANLVNNR